MFQPDARQAAMMVLRLLDAKTAEGRSVSRARLTELTIRRLWGRTRVQEAFLLDVQEILLNAGWALFWAGSSYAVIRLSAIEGWPRISSKRIEFDLDRLARDRRHAVRFFDEIEHLLLAEPNRRDEEEDASE
jgi:hypothetical protein